MAEEGEILTAEEIETDRMKLVLGETVKLASGSFKKYEVEYLSFRKSQESTRDCFLRCVKATDAMAKVMALKIKENLTM